MKLDHSLVGKRKYFYVDEDDEGEDTTREKVYYTVGRPVFMDWRILRFEVSGWGHFPFKTVIQDEF